jgi:hypothetical protein
LSEIYYAYNEKMSHYHELPLAGKRGQAFLDKKNQERQGGWILHTKEQYQEWYEKIGKHRETIEFIRNYGIVPR